MLDVASLEKFELLNKLRLVSGANGLYRNITNVVILDYEGIEGDFSGFHEGDFVITNLLFAKNDISKIYPAFEALIKLGVSAFAIKTVFFDKLPDDILELTEKNEVPVFLFNNIYIEDVILSITDHLRSSSNYNYYENLIDSFLTSPSKQLNIKEFVNSLSPVSDSLKSENLVTTLYLMSENETDEFTLQRNINKLTLRAKHLSIAVSIKILKYKKGILLICFGNETTNYENILKTVISELSLSSYTIGFSDFSLPLNKIDISIERSINSCIFALKNQKKIVKYSNLGLYNFIFTLSKDRYAHEYLEEKSAVFNTQKNKPLFSTMSALVNNGFDINKTAESLFQHPNTVRYRIEKLKSLFNTNTELEFQFLCTILISQYDTSSSHFRKLQ